MVEFAGYNMPIQYRSINQEHLKVRKSVGLFDLSHMGEFFVKGDGALEFIQKMTTNDASTLKVYQVQYSSLPYPEGGLVDDLLVYRLPDAVYVGGQCRQYRQRLGMAIGAQTGRDRLDQPLG